MQGIVERIYSNNWNDKMLYSIKLVGNDPSYGLGETNPGEVVGGEVEFDAYQKGKYWRIVKDTLKILKQPTAQQTTAAKAETSSREEYWLQKDVRDQAEFNAESPRQSSIQIQSARKDALAFLALAASVDCLAISKSKSAADRFEALRALVDVVTNDFLDSQRGPGPDPSEEFPKEVF